MLKSGVAINEALANLAEQARSKKFSQILFQIKERIEKGASLSDAFSKYPKIFDRIFLSLVLSGENSGTFEENFDFAADWLDRENDLKREIRSATLYPKIVLSATLILGVLLTTYVLPKLVPIFTQFEVELPLVTRIVFSISIFFKDFWWLVITGLILFFTGYILLKKINIVNSFLDALYIKIPVFGTLIKEYQLALISQIFFTLFKSGLHAQEILNVVGEAVTNNSYKKSIALISRRIELGAKISDVIKNYPNLYPKQFVTILIVGEKSGTLTDSFKYLAEFYLKEVRSKTKNLPVIIEPLLLIFMALIVCLVAFAIVLPIYQLTLFVSS